jgi:hypothetical protein
MLPRLGCEKPVIRLKTVVFPAPLGRYLVESDHIPLEMRSLQLYREVFAFIITCTSPVTEPTVTERRIAIAKIIAVGDSPCSTIALVSIGAIGETLC